MKIILVRDETGKWVPAKGKLKVDGPSTQAPKKAS